MIFDIRTGHFVGNTGFIAVDTPPLGGVAHFLATTSPGTSGHRQSLSDLCAFEF
jgi:hypothetical protein